MMFLVPVKKNATVEAAWKQAPERHLFYDVMHVTEKVANQTPPGCKTFWTDLNFIRVFFHHYIQSNSYIVDDNFAESIVWLTQASRRDRFLGICRSVSHASVRERTAREFALVPSEPKLALNWLTTGDRLRGRNISTTSAGAQSNQTTQHPTMALWVAPVGTDRVAVHIQQQQSDEHQNRVESDDGDFDMNHSGNDGEENVANSGQDNNQNAPPPPGHAQEPLQFPNQQQQLPVNNQGNANPVRNHMNGIVVGNNTTQESLTWEMVQNCQLVNFTIKCVRLKFLKAKDYAPLWCPYFSKNKKTDIFSQMMSPPNWLDINRKRRTALDVLMVRLVLAQMFAIMYKDHCTPHQAIAQVLDVAVANTPFTPAYDEVENRTVIATVASLVENNGKIKDKISNIKAWLNFGKADRTFNSVEDIINSETGCIRSIVEGALRSMDHSVINQAVFNHHPGWRLVDKKVFENTLIPIPETNLPQNFVQMNSEIIIQHNNGNYAECWHMTKMAIAHGNITYVVTSSIWNEYKIYLGYRNDYLARVKHISREAAEGFIGIFETYINSRGYHA